MTNNTVVTWVHGEKAERFHAAFGPSLDAYARRVTGRPALVLTHAPPAAPAACVHVGKWAAYDLLDTYDRYLWADADVWFGPDAPDLFALTPAGHLGCQWEDEGHIDPQFMRDRLARLCPWAGVEPDWTLPDMTRSCCAGLYVADRNCRPWLKPHPTPDRFDNFMMEQDWQQFVAMRAGRLHVWPVETCYVASTNSPSRTRRPIHHWAGHSHPPAATRT